MKTISEPVKKPQMNTLTIISKTFSPILTRLLYKLQTAKTNFIKIIKNNLQNAMMKKCPLQEKENHRKLE